MRTLLILASVIYFSSITTYASLVGSSGSFNTAELATEISETSKLSDLQVLDRQLQDDHPVVSGINLQVDSLGGSLALLAAFAGMTFVMIRRRQAS